jgi:SHS family lactate transporter-like MFS transporter
MDNYSEEKPAAAAHIPDAPVESHAPPKMSVGQYAATRITTLKPPMNKAPNPLRLLAMLSGKQWLFFLVGFLAWVSSTHEWVYIHMLTRHSPGMPSISSPSA